MMNYYHPQTKERIVTTNPADWMGQTEVDPPTYDPKAQGCFWRGGSWEITDPAPPEIEPAVCTPWQIRKALNSLGLRDAVEQAVASATGDGSQTLKDGWEFATQFVSTDPFVIGMGASLGKSEAETTELIRYASTL